MWGRRIKNWHSSDRAQGYCSKLGTTQIIETDFFKELQILLRDSLVKFRSDYNVLEVLNVSQPILGVLSRQTIFHLLYLGVAPESLIDLHREALQDAYYAATSPETAVSSKFLLKVEKGR